MCFQKPDLNAELGGGRCPVHYAGDMGQTDVMEYLILNGADINVSYVFNLNYVPI